VRWQQLFDDLEAQLEAADATALAGEVADRTRYERAQIELADRLTGATGQRVVLHLTGGSTSDGMLVEVAQQWCLMAAPTPVLVPLHALVSISGLGRAAVTVGRDGVSRRASLVSTLRALARDRSPVQVGLGDGSVLGGTLDAVGADHVDLAEHEADEPRRAGSVRTVRTVPLTALSWLRPAAGSSSLQA
jgi:small nuclear ribonucleoprotein (snRNP)-like protein